jgi:TPR repeat protein
MLIHENGHGVDQSSFIAMRWYAKAAAQGSEGAQARITPVLERRATQSNIEKQKEVPFLGACVPVSFLLTSDSNSRTPY